MISRLFRLWIGACAAISVVLSGARPCSSQEAKPPSAENQPPGAPDARDVLKKLAQYDSIFKSGFTASGTLRRLGRADIPGPYYKVRANWRLTLKGGRVGYDINVTDYETPKHPIPTGVLLRHWGYWGDDASGDHDVDACLEIAPDGKAKRVGTMYNSMLYGPKSIALSGHLHSFQWPLGRFFSERLDKITSVERTPTGRLRVSALGSEYEGSNARWELEIEPSAAWMVRRARFYSGSPPGKTEAEMVNEGTTWSGSLCIPTRARVNPYGPLGDVEDPKTGTKTQCFEFQTAVGGFDEELYKQAQQNVLHCKEPKLTVTDERVSPRRISEPNAPRR